MQKFIIFFLLVFLTVPPLVSARIGVGIRSINKGHIIADRPLKPGEVYNFPSQTISNTGDESSDYEMGIAYQESNQLRPAQEWFSFNPSPFYLEPGQAQTVEVKMNLPKNAQPGDYFAYLQGRPIIKSDGSGVTAIIGVAAANRLYFTVVPANIWQAVAFRISSFLTIYGVWILIAAGIIALMLIAVVARNRFSFRIAVRRSRRDSFQEKD